MRRQLYRPPPRHLRSSRGTAPRGSRISLTRQQRHTGVQGAGCRRRLARATAAYPRGEGGVQTGAGRASRRRHASRTSETGGPVGWEEVRCGEVHCAESDPDPLGMTARHQPRVTSSVDDIHRGQSAHPRASGHALPRTCTIEPKKSAINASTPQNRPVARARILGCGGRSSTVPSPRTHARAAGACIDAERARARTSSAREHLYTIHEWTTFTALPLRAITNLHLRVPLAVSCAAPAPGTRSPLYPAITRVMPRARLPAAGCARHMPD